MKKLLTCGILMLSLVWSHSQSLPIIHSVWTTNATPTQGADSSSTQIGTGATASVAGTAVGVNANANNTSVAVGEGALGQGGGVAVGVPSAAINGGVAVGNGAISSLGLVAGQNNVAVGNSAVVNSASPGGVTNSMEFGTGTGTNENTVHFWGQPAIVINPATKALTLKIPATSLAPGSTSNLVANAVQEGSSGVTLSGTFSGNGSGLTGLVSSSTNANSANIAQTINSTNNSLPNYPLAISAAGMSETRIHGENWQMKRPLFIIEDQPYYGGGAESNLWNILNWMIQNGELTNIQQAGVDVAFLIDGGWDSRRNVNPAFVFTNLGTLTWDPILLPDGIPYIASVLHSNNCKLMLTLGESSLPLPPGVTGGCNGWNGGVGLQYYTNGTGPGNQIYTNGGWHNVEITFPQNLLNDVSEMEWWGVDGLVLEDATGNTLDSQIQIQVTVSDGIQRLYTPPTSVFGQTVGSSSAINMNLGSMTLSYTNGWNLSPTNPLSFASFFAPTVSPRNWFTNTMMFFPYERTSQDNRNLGDFTAAFHNGVEYENENSPCGNTRTYLTNYLADYAGLEKISHGGAGVLVGNGNGTFSTFALFAQQQISAPTWGSFNFTNSIGNSYPLFTNAMLMSIWEDQLQAKPVMVKDYGVGIGTVWRKDLYGGDIAVAWCPESGYIYPTNFTWDMMGVTTNQPIVVSHENSLYGFCGDYTATFTVTNSQGFVGNFMTNTVVIGGFSGACGIFRLHGQWGSLH